MSLQRHGREQTCYVFAISSAPPSGPRAGPPWPACQLEENEPMSQTNVTVPSGGSGMGAGMIVGLLVAVIIIGLLIWWFLLGGGGGTTTESTAPLESLLQSILPSTAPSGT